MKDIIQAQYCDEMQKAYLDYSMSVITDRAVPDIRDGLKPVQRRTIYAMYKLGLDASHPHRKSARIVGDTMGKYHPHGDSSIYDALVVMQQDFKKNVALVDGHGNFGSVEGDGAAAMRYTEARLHEFTMDIYLADIDKDVVDFRPNFDETEQEPVVLPARLPMALINGAEGIAVGMSTSIPPHNLGEITDAMITMLDRPNIRREKLHEIVTGPDFPMPCEVINRADLAAIYESGNGRLSVRGMMEDGRKNGRKAIIITALPPTMLGQGIGRFLDELVSLSDKRLTTDIADISNETDENGIRIVVEVRRGGDVEQLKRLIQSKTRFTDTVSVSMLVIREGKACIMGLREMLQEHLQFFNTVERRKATHLLEQARDREEVLEGLIRAVDIIDLIIEILRGSRSIEMAKNCLINGMTDGIAFKSEASERAARELFFTQRQAQAILAMRLSKLIGLEIFALKDEYQEVLAAIHEYETLLSDEKAMKRHLKTLLRGYKKKYDHPRMTVLSDTQIEKYTVQKKEVQLGIEIDENDYIRASTTVGERLALGSFDKLALITSTGRQMLIKAEDIPVKKGSAKGVPLETLCDYDRTVERILHVAALADVASQSLLFVTAAGLGKRVDGSAFQTTVYNTQATRLRKDDELVAVLPVTDADHVVVRTAKQAYFRTTAEEISTLGKVTLGPKLLRLDADDRVAEVLVTDKLRESELQFQHTTVMLSRFRPQKVGARPVKYQLD
ncbi:MAG: DNA topoisomerase (ATP-hydrolyzing) subunit A [Eubacteriales bacterium]|nr:DNA topoisomerase (ATP-hydrolyzing) subunit A [Eubacteriales bacterium]